MDLIMNNINFGYAQDSDTLSCARLLPGSHEIWLDSRETSIAIKVEVSSQERVEAWVEMVSRNFDPEAEKAETISCYSIQSYGVKNLWGLFVKLQLPLQEVKGLAGSYLAIDPQRELEITAGYHADWYVKD